ncbi:MAG: hypothetical protein ACC700_18415 [Anaerolineales bacterium]
MRKLGRVYLRHQVARFVLMFTGRSGSSYLINLLNSHPYILALGEELAILHNNGAEAQANWVTDFLTAPPISWYKARGFKVKLVDVADPTGLTSLLRESNCRIIHMTRRNQVKAVISRINALRLWEKTGEWNLYSERNRPSPIRVDVPKFDELLEHRARVDTALEEFVSQLALPTQTIFYEDLLVLRDTVLQRTFEFLGVPSRPVHGDTRKNTSDDLRDVIINFEELRSRYLGTAYGQMFDEILTP